MGSFTQKRIEIHLTLGAGVFDSGQNTKIITDLYCSVNIDKPGPPDKNKATVSVRGMRLNDMERYTTLSFGPTQNEHNLIAIFAGDENGVNQIFAGEVTQAYGNFNNAPDTVFNIEAMSGFYPSITPPTPKSFNGEVNVADLLEQLAQEIGYIFINKLGVKVMLSNPHLNGSPMRQIQYLAKMANIDCLVDDNQVIISPKYSGNGDMESSGNAVLLNNQTGKIEYAVITKEGIEAKCLFNNALKQGGLVKIESVVPKASGVWRINKLTHKLDNSSAGSWESQIKAAYVS